MKRTARLVLLLAGAAFASVGHAATQADQNAGAGANLPPDPAARVDQVAIRFQILDADGDGRLSRDEFTGAAARESRWWNPEARQTGAETARYAGTAAQFADLDVNHDGYLSPLELSAGATRRPADAGGSRPP